MFGYSFTVFVSVFQLLPTVPYRVLDMGGSTAVAGLFHGFLTFSSAASAPFAGPLSDRIGRWRVIGAGWVLYAAVYAGFAMTSAPTVWPLFATYGLYMALTDGVGKALIADHAPAERRGLALGVFYMAVGTTTLVSNIVAGLLWDHVGPAATFWIGAVAALASVLMLPVTIHWARRRAT